MPTSGAPAAAGPVSGGITPMFSYSLCSIETAHTTPTPKMSSDTIAVKMIFADATRSSSWMGWLIAAPYRCRKSTQSIRGPYGPRSHSLADARSWPVLQRHRQERIADGDQVLAAHAEDEEADG